MFSFSGNRNIQRRSNVGNRALNQTVVLRFIRRRRRRSLAGIIQSRDHIFKLLLDNPVKFWRTELLLPPADPHLLAIGIANHIHPEQNQADKYKNGFQASIIDSFASFSNILNGIKTINNMTGIIKSPSASRASPACRPTAAEFHPHLLWFDSIVL